MAKPLQRVCTVDPSSLSLKKERVAMEASQRKNNARLGDCGGGNPGLK
jgi:hypothetical protein